MYEDQNGDAYPYGDASYEFEPYRYVNDYDDIYVDEREQPQPFFIPPNAIQQELNRGRRGHFYRTRLASYNQMMLIQLLGINQNTGMVSMNVYLPWQRRWVQHQEHFSDMSGLTYVGPTPPPGVPFPRPTQPPRPPRPWWCPQFPWHPACR
ncbi:hypothetical protein [Sporolactobacillus terrae]|uniref:Uncharacterized protein n=1 Tax=Sporolactobacillus terrae TaxID=269673 RepID=A0A5K7WVY9_9BACL|nr:hypothetical protein [Sporolactobacillus terrae]UAK16321.1 hypothetical protein K7399_15425 [Sporolactobacillus terrae]BBN97804.1 hypothetical protein St703_05090 [Sporolactobacillus terrae]